MNKLIIAEKPSMGRTIAKAVGAYAKKDGYFEGGGFIVSWCFGHLYELSDLESYLDPDYRKGDKVVWSLAQLPFYPEGWNFRYEPKSGCEKQIRVLEELMNREDIGTVYSAGDADREGEVIVRLVIENGLKTKKDLRRLWLPALTPEEIQRAIEKDEPLEKYDALYQAGRARASADWLLGIELTRYVTLRGKKFFRIGRCVCPITARIAQREKEIEAFTPRQYLVPAARAEILGKELTLISKSEFSPEDEEAARQRCEVLSVLPAKVLSVSRTRKVIPAGKLFSLSDLQSYICKRNKEASPKDVLQAAQELYEAGFITYPRTSSNYLSEGEEETSAQLIKDLHEKGFRGMKMKPGDRRIFDSSKVESHSAILPTNRIPEGLTGIKAEVYRAIQRRFFAAFCEDECLEDEKAVVIRCGDEEFTLKGRSIVQKGWMNVEEPERQEKELPELYEGYRFPVRFIPEMKDTKPPKRYTVGSLNAWMKAPFRDEEMAGDYTEAEWKDILEEATICTEATRADTIDRCIRSGYLELKDGTYYPKENGFRMLELMQALQADLSAEKTAQLSKSLHDIAAGKEKPEQVLEKTKEMLDGIFRAGEGIELDTEMKREVTGRCPRCGGDVTEKKAVFSCDSKGCGFVLFKDSRLLSSVSARMTKELAEELLASGKSGPMDLYSKKKQKYFRACIELKDDGGTPQLSLSFPVERGMKRGGDAR